MKNSNFKEVKTFMETFKQKVRTEPQWPTDEEVDLRIDLIREELNELEEACDKGTLVDVAEICPSWERMENRCIVKMERS